MLRIALPLLSLALFASGAAAQVPSPEAFLGYALGDRFTPHHRVVDYVTAVAEASPRVSLEVYGETPEGRPLLALTVAAEGVDTEAVRLSRLAAARGEGPPRMPVVWLSYNVHGNESVSTEAAMATLYTLASGDPAETGLDRAIVVMDPCLNPDGRERYVSFYRQRRGAHPDPAPEAWEHDEPWPGGRFNHYLFDLNRDWAWGTQPETRARLPLYQAWRPSVHVDFHEQGVDSPYFFAPAAEPFHPAITDWQRQLQRLIGAGNAEAFDAEDRLYFTREVFDLFYPGYGDTWPTFNGAVGMTYEQGGSGRAGLAIRTAEGDTLRLADRIRGHMLTGLATVRVTAANAERVTREFAAYHAGRASGAPAAYALAGPQEKLDAVASLLSLQGIEVAEASGEQSATGVRYGGGLSSPTSRERQTVPEGALVIRTEQPAGALAHVLLQPEPALGDSLTYDVTAWALPYVYGLTGMALDAPPATRPTTAREPLAPEAGRPYAYASAWDGPGDATFLARLLREGVGVRIAPAPFEASGETFGRGALLITRAGNARLGDRFDAVVREAADRAGQMITPLASGFIPGGLDAGSNQVGFVRAPRVAVLAGEPVSPTALGEIWSLFDQTWGYPLTLLPTDADASALRDVDVLILPDGGYGGWLSESRAESLRDWVRAGGRLLALERAALALARRDGYALATRDAPEADSSAEARLRRYADRARDRASGDTPGAVFRVTLDDSHPLAYGYPDWTYVLRRRTAPVDFLARGWNVGVLRSGEPVAGFAGSEAQDRFEDSLVFGVEDVGRGHVVYLLDSPVFRGFWRDGELMMANAVFGLGAQ